LGLCLHLYTDFAPSYQEPYRRYVDAQIGGNDKSYDRNFNSVGNAGPAAGAFDSTLDVTERQYRAKTGSSPAENRFDGPSKEQVRITERTSRSTVDGPKHKRDMGYYDDEGQYHSFRRGVQRVAERIAHPITGPSLLRHHHHRAHGGESSEREQVTITKEREIEAPESHHRVSYGSSHGATHGSSHSASYAREEPESSQAMSPNTITIPCHHIRIGDLLMLQGRPCQVIRITTSAATGQHRYLGVDLFTKQLHEESSFISTPAPSVVVQNMLGPVFKQYRVLDIREDGSVVAMTETGDIKQSLPVLDQSSLFSRLGGAFDNGRGSIRVLVLDDEGRELIVDFKVVHGSRL
jgi:hypothetical protein